jgi:hypothetical protein
LIAGVSRHGYDNSRPEILHPVLKASTHIKKGGTSVKFLLSGREDVLVEIVETIMFNRRDR